MNITSRLAIALCAIAGIVCEVADAVHAQEVDVRLSTRETYVGQPIELAITINNAKDFQQPRIPDIDGCDVRLSGPPAQATRTVIINGRRSDTQSLTLKYLITPTRPGTFEIPSFTIDVNGRQRQTQSVEFVASRSETGDLLFVEIVGDKPQVYVGQPLELSLKIWIKPFVDSERDIRLSEGSMWQMISRRTDWGSFGAKLQTMADSNQRPGGTEVLRDDGTGKKRAYYMYQIETTIYPQRPGKLDAENVQIVVDYPTGLAKKRGMFGGSLFDSHPFADRDPFDGFSQLLKDDLFASPFDDRLVVTGTRPIVAEAQVGAAEAIPVPNEGRPDDYRGAVGSYRIATKATPTEVSAGDPITLQIGIIGTGPMELVQAPPLSQLSALTTDFKVEDQSLGGFVQGDTKLFTTTLRPRREGIAEIPPIPFSFFDPETAAFQTVSSQAIAITVNRAETLALDAIVGNARIAGNVLDSDPALAKPAKSTGEPNLANKHSFDILDAQPSRRSSSGWVLLVVVPPCIWLSALLWRHGSSFSAAGMATVGRLRSPESRCLDAIGRAIRSDQLADSLREYIGLKTRSQAANAAEALGILRLCGLYAEAAELDSCFTEWDRLAYQVVSAEQFEHQRQRAGNLISRIKLAFDQLGRLPHRLQARNGSQRGQLLNTTGSSLLLLMCLQVFTAGQAHGASLESVPQLSLSRQQQETILAEAAALYERGTAFIEADPAAAKEAFAEAARKYRQLVDSGIRNSHLFLNLGNAYLQANQLGHAIAVYEQGRSFDPTNYELNINSEFARSLVRRNAAEQSLAERPAVGSRLLSMNAWLIHRIGLETIGWVIGGASILFWGLLTAGIVWRGFPARRLAILPLGLLLIGTLSMVLAGAGGRRSAHGYLVENRITLRTSDGGEFAEVTTLTNADGLEVQILNQRSGWMEIQTATGQRGWIPSAACVAS
jgi:tetratricopeptide (TPR) repeat protein